MTDWGCEGITMDQKRMIMIDEESFKDKALEIVHDMNDKGGPHISLTAMLAFIELQQKLFYPEKESKEKESEKKEQE